MSALSIAPSSSIGGEDPQYSFTSRGLCRAEGDGAGESETLDERTRRLLLELVACISTASVEGWDGAGAKPVDAGAMERGIRFIFALPNSAPAPMIGVDPDGDLQFEWVAGKRLRLSMSLDHRNVVSFAASLPAGDIWGQEDFVGAVPAGVWDALRKIYSVNRHR